jgi:hypothetical protein
VSTSLPSLGLVISNTGANPITLITLSWSIDPAGLIFANDRVINAALAALGVLAVGDTWSLALPTSVYSIAQLALTSAAATTATVQWKCDDTALSTATVNGVPSSGAGGQTPTQETFVALVGQVLFPLATAPTNAVGVTLFVNGVEYRPTVDYTLALNVITWTNAPFVMAAGDVVTITYHTP